MAIRWFVFETKRTSVLPSVSTDPCYLYIRYLDFIQQMRGWQSLLNIQKVQVCMMM